MKILKWILRLLKKLLIGLVGLILLAIILLYIFDYEYILKGVRVVYFTGHTTAYIDDFPHFDTHTIEAGTHKPIPKHKEYNSVKSTETLSQTNQNLGTVAFLIIKNDSIWYEKYADGYGLESKTNSFSMAKSIVTLMLGKAIEDGHIKSLEQPVSDFLPKFTEGKASKLTVGDLSSMASGLNWNEHYSSPFSITARSYYHDNIRDLMLGLEVIEEPGQAFDYKSGATELLAMAIEKATGTTLSKYLSQSFWKPLGMASDGIWQVDSEESGLEKAYCCIGSNARDFARFGLLVNHQGRFQGQQILAPSFINKITTARFSESPQYGYGYWLSDYKGKKIKYMRGILGQYTVSIPEDNLVIVRLGHQRGSPIEDNPHFDDFFTYIDESYKMLGQ